MEIETAGAFAGSSDQSATRGIRARLRDGTADLHATLDRDLAFLRAPTLPAYRRFLEAMYGFYLPLDEALACLDTIEPAPFVPLRERAPLLRRDLEALGATDPDIARLAVACLPGLTRPGHFAGALYVVEGANLGGQVIARVLARHLEMDANSGAAFFTGEGPATAARWKRVLAWLDAFADAGARETEMLHGARMTFSALHEWLDCRGVLQ